MNTNTAITAGQAVSFAFGEYVLAGRVDRVGRGWVRVTVSESADLMAGREMVLDLEGVTAL